jgi:AmiR/NasT family two-component response regulator
MDIRLPGRRDGIEAVRVLRKELRVPIIFLSAYSDPETVERAKTIEPHGYIVKPFTEGELRCAIEVAIYESRLESRTRNDAHLFEEPLHASKKNRFRAKYG